MLKHTCSYTSSCMQSHHVFAHSSDSQERARQGVWHQHSIVHLQTLTASCDCMDTGVSSAGYKYLASRMKREGEEAEPDAQQEAHDHFLVQLDELEALLSKHAGPYLVG